MRLLSSLRRRRVRTQLATSPQSCEQRTLLASGAIYPLPAPSSVDLSRTNSDVQPAAESEDFFGLWHVAADGEMQIEPKGNPASLKVKGTFANSSIEGTAKLKGYIANVSLIATVRGRALLGTTVGRTKLEFAVFLTDPTQFSGTVHVTFRGQDLGVGPVFAHKL